MRREEFCSELDFRWNSGDLTLERYFDQAGYWEKNGGCTLHGSLQAQPATDFLRKRITEQILEFKPLLQSASRSQILWTSKLKRIGNEQFKTNSWYSMVEVDGECFSLTCSDDSADLRSKIDGWYKGIQTHCSLPMFSESFEAQFLELSPAAFGLLLHEMLGHSLEDPTDDHLARRFKADFHVFDGPGLPHMVGWCPFDDYGTPGQEVMLLDGQSGVMKPLTADTGNMRSVGWNWHPIVRQRCLSVRPYKRQSISLQGAGPRLIIDEAQMGTWDLSNERAVLHVGRSRFVTADGAIYKLPRLTFVFAMEILSSLKVGGQVEEFSPGGGCHKGLQRGLPVTFISPSAWVELDGISDLVKIYAR